ncbi:right-handed parallel beta-helix repeat-containing protein [Archangium violaceum]|uniref:right-handed parallel beta-helix repeat-containing protein n=1 Tax=Archangium violaceum TaxID=83451 RepID=UPI001951DEC1|nr:right-handed parallel beta-helix repeat-containing protein [Archangium violaceum]QRO00602.1 right-handed parallel beta-helix repeat-containing protein [Archangium violaceum]
MILSAFLCVENRAHAAVGATTPFISYEAEAGTVGGGASVSSLTSPPTTQYSSPELEASGHAYVRLTGTGQYVQWVNDTGKNITAINVRASIPDAPNGGGITATLNLYVNGVFRQALTLSSKQTWLYEGNNNYQGNNQNPADGAPRVFYDDMHTFITGAAVPPGATIRLQKDAANTASFYYIDVVDLEAPPPPLTQPANSLSITSYGAVANDSSVDNSAAIQNCINAAQSQGKSVWIPVGTFYVRTTGGINATGITIQGAGMWYSTIYRNMPLPNANPLGAIFNLTSCTVRNFALDSNAPSRAVVDGCGGGMDTTGTNWLADSIWTQHTMSGFWASGTGGTVQNCRLTSIWADGFNLNNVSLTGTVGNNLTGRNNFVRGTGDDAIAINSVDYNGSQHYTPMSNATLLNNTSIAPWGGKGIGIYGGSGHLVKDNYMSDTARYVGLGVMKFGVNGSDLLSGTVTGNTVVRSGGNGFVQQQPALHIGNGGDGQNVGTVANVTVSGNTVIDSLYNGVGFSTSSNILFENNTIISPGLDGVVISPPFYPAPTGSATIRGNTVSGLEPGRYPFLSFSNGFVATVTGNSWPDGSPRKLIPGMSVSLQAVGNGMYVCAEDAGSSPLIANRTAAGPWETYTVVDAGNGNIALRAQINEMYVCAENTGSSPLIANRTAVGPWESFTEVDAGNGNIALRAQVNGLYVSASNSGNGPLIANQASVGAWETFAVQIH